MMKVSVIIPIYNTEKQLAKCLESVMAQTLRDIEIICVNDGSTDDSLNIVKKYAKTDSRIKIIDKENGGLVSARKAGIEAACGKYVGYVDSDDWIEPKMYETLYEYAERYKADMVSSGYVFEGDYVSEHFDGIEEGLYSEEKIRHLRDNAIYNLETKEVGLRGSLCCKLFLRDKFTEVQLDIPNDVTASEDKLCVVAYVLKCERIYILRKAFYHYIKYESSMAHAPKYDYLLKVHAIYNYFTHLYDNANFSKRMRLQAELYITELLYKGINSRLGFENKNMLWIDPYWVKQIPANSNVALYGSGDLSDIYYSQLCHCRDLNLVVCVDKHESVRRDGRVICAVDVLQDKSYDYIVITVKNQEKAEQERKFLKSIGIPEEKICWYEQQEVYWKFAEANGYLEMANDEIDKNNG